MQKQPVTHLCVVSALVLVVFGCSPATTNETLNTDDNGSTIGIVSYVDLEGGFYGIVTDQGARHNPLNLPVKFRVDSLSVSYKYKTLQNVASIQMWGTPIEILEIQEQSNK